MSFIIFPIHNSSTIDFRKLRENITTSTSSLNEASLGQAAQRASPGHSSSEPPPLLHCFGQSPPIHRWTPKEKALSKDYVQNRRVVIPKKDAPVLTHFVTIYTQYPACRDTRKLKSTSLRRPQVESPWSISEVCCVLRFGWVLQMVSWWNQAFGLIRLLPYRFFWSIWIFTSFPPSCA